MLIHRNNEKKTHLMLHVVILLFVNATFKRVDVAVCLDSVIKHCMPDSLGQGAWIKGESFSLGSSNQEFSHNFLCSLRVKNLKSVQERGIS